MWSTLEENCADVVYKTNITVNLTSILIMNDPVTYISSVINIISEGNLQENHIDLITQFLEQLISHTQSNTLWASIIDKLVDTPEQVLRLAQKEYKSVERILRCMNILTQQLGPTKILQPNVMILSKIHTKNLEYISWYLLEYGGYQLEIHFEGEDTNNINITNTRADIYLHHLKTRYVTIIIFNQANFFDCRGFYQKFSQPVMQFFNSDNTEHLKEDLLTVKYQQQAEHDTICFVSSFDSEKRFWPVSNRTLADSNGQNACQFPYGKYFGLIEKTNVTKELELILSEKLPIEDSLERTNELLKYFFSVFEPLDVKYVTDIVGNIKVAKNMKTVTLFFEIFNEILNIDFIVMKVAEQIYESGSKMLLYTEKIIHQIKEKQTISHENLYFSHLNHEINIKVQDCDDRSCKVMFFEGTQNNCETSDICIIWPPGRSKSASVIILFTNKLKFFDSFSKSTKFVGLFDGEAKMRSLIDVAFKWKEQNEAVVTMCKVSGKNPEDFKWEDTNPRSQNSALVCAISSG